MAIRVSSQHLAQKWGPCWQGGSSSAFARAQEHSHDHSTGGHAAARPPNARRRLSMGAEKFSPEPAENRNKVRLLFKKPMMQ